MSELVSDEGIVLRRRAYAEADRILVMITRGQGKISVLAKGARRARARNAAGLDLLTRSELLLVPGRGMATVAQARPVGLPWP
ncbi:MAG: DNA repair protein RecO, partial [Candidatus Dormiibacterota bacterium]